MSRFGLDPVNQQVMEDIIRDMAKRGRTVLFSTHVMQHARTIVRSDSATRQRAERFLTALSLEAKGNHSAPRAD